LISRFRRGLRGAQPLTPPIPLMKRDLVKWQLDQMIARRHVFFIAGYDPIDPVSQHRPSEQGAPLQT
jgi:hypothetical protein